MKVVAWITFIFINQVTLVAQTAEARWHFTLSNADVKLHEDNQLIIAVDLPEGWGLYASDFQAETFGPTPTIISFDNSKDYVVIDNVRDINPVRAEEPSFDLQYAYFTTAAEFRQSIRLMKSRTNIKGVISGKLFNLNNGKTIPFEKTFDFTIDVDANN
ncbi:MAG: hypothetical protein EBR30_10200 [Cytophagia bacterium]|nr:hypothetical protein [Cytophagia bacterium]NBW35369.1 hypothetical protein [Cytophagia bacterium]